MKTTVKQFQKVTKEICLIIPRKPEGEGADAK